MIVVDASAVVALFADGGLLAEHVAAVVEGKRLAAVHLLPFEVHQTLRRLEMAKVLTPEVVTLIRNDVDELPVELWPFEVVADRVWQLRRNLTAYDASYVALAELLSVPLVTLDAKLARAPGRRCPVTVVEA